LGSNQAHLLKELNDGQTQQIFLQAIKDFKAGRISLDELSIISLRLWSEGIKDEDKFGSRLASTLYYGGELNFYVRPGHISQKIILQTFVQFLGNVLKFYDDKSG